MESKLAPVIASEVPDASGSVTRAESAARKDPEPSVPAPPTRPTKDELPLRMAESIAFACALASAEVIIGRTPVSYTHLRAHET